ncbi:MAG: hypothetical protein A2086_08380 [Spirochaetes bacterium GWD1_27_9]|nr:MAG: hypothetical protein A2Z98_13400 [Spirochaetes bacterium GWB1_27_13]OHD20915.1 MAG: hypothetical protein A2Y34_11820 [Spirochaetes bacterium GWC1_27_15]OHD39416.1 MAG: hypothetical protein A2086_08380 [Spirochaetes bacterium GWD1_27_9]
MTDKVFIDSNLWIYLYENKEDRKQEKIEELINNNFNNIVISTQVLNEIYNILNKKIRLEHSQIKEIIVETITNFSVAEIGVLDIIKAMELKEIYGFSYWDSLIIASALENQCKILFSEDMQNGQIIENRLKIINPF